MKSRTEARAFADLAAQGVLSIAAAGNDGNNRNSYPASYDAVVSVAALDHKVQRASFSQYNSQVELSAPGVDTLSTISCRYGYDGIRGGGWYAIQRKRHGKYRNRNSPLV